MIGIPLAFPYPQDASLRTEEVGRAPAVLRAHGLVEQLRASCGEIIDFGDIDPALPDKSGLFRELETSLAHMERTIGAAAEQCDRLVILGGSCSIAAATLPAMHRLYPDLHVLWFDAHADCLNETESQSHYLGGMALASVIGHTTLAERFPGSHLTLLSGRGADWNEIGTMRQFGVTHIYPQDVMAWLHRQLPTDNLFVHLDVDVLSESDMPAVDLPLWPGMSLAELEEALALIARTGRLRGVELTAYNPALDKTGQGRETVRRALAACLPTDTAIPLPVGSRS